MRWTLLILLAAVACKKTPPPDPAGQTTDETERPAELPPPGSQHAPPPAAAPEPDPGGTTVTAERAPPDVATLQSVVRKLSVKDPAPDCQALADSLDVDPRATFLYVVDSVENPPWTPMRAAGCLLALYPEESEPVFASWLRDESRGGLGRLVLSKLPTLPESVAVNMVKVGLGGPLEDATREAALASERPAVKAAAAP